MEVPKGMKDLHQAQRNEGQRILLEMRFISETDLSEIKEFNLVPVELKVSEKC